MDRKLYKKVLKYYKEPQAFNGGCNYSLAGGEIRPLQQRVCFSEFWSFVYQGTEIITVLAEGKYLFCSDELIERWVGFMNEWGFPVTFEKKEKDYEFYFKLAEYEKRWHLCAALTLIRCVWEYNVDFVMPAFFELIETYPDIESFQLLQYAYKKYRDLGGYHSAGHSIVDTQFRTLILKNTYCKRLEKTKSILTDAAIENERYSNPVYRLFHGEVSNEKDIYKLIEK